MEGGKCPRATTFPLRKKSRTMLITSRLSSVILRFQVLVYGYLFFSVVCRRIIDMRLSLLGVGCLPAEAVADANAIRPGCVM